jgi:hypothetical protein
MYSESPEPKPTLLAKATFVADKDEIRPQYQNPTSGAQVFSSTIVRDLGPQFNAGATIDQLDSIPQTSAGQNQEVVMPWYSDQILPFDVTIAGANEYGAMCAAKIFGIEILNEGWGSSIDDAVSEQQATFVARTVKPMLNQGEPSFPPFRHLLIRLLTIATLSHWIPQFSKLLQPSTGG